MAQGGRIGFNEGGGLFEKLFANKSSTGSGVMSSLNTSELMDVLQMLQGIAFAKGGRAGAEEGGLMNLGGMEKDEMLEVDAYSTLLKNVDTVYEKVGIPSYILQEHSDWESEKLNMFDTMSGYKSWLDTNYPKSPIGTYLYHLPKEEKMDIVEKISIKKALGGRAGFMGGGMTSRTPMEEGGIMDLGGMEKDYRAEGGFVPIGKKEKADDVPARLSVNEFVFTADAVRNAGGGDIDKGAEVMENMMKNLEAGGEVSEESQGMQGARDMFQTSQSLEGVM